MAPDPRQIVERAVAGALARAAIRPGASILAAVSGGADSTALLHVLLDLRERSGFRVAAAHLNHRIRGAESDRDEAFVRAMCARLGVDAIVERASGLRAGMPNLEERAREARHAFLNRAADSIGAAHIALAHHSDDQAETVMIRLMRGAGAAGMGAMAPVGPGRIIRPLLELSRAEIIAYLRARRIGFVEDSSNRSPAILRNRVRAELLPMLERDYAPGLSRRLVELAGEMRSLGDLAASAAAREIAAMRHADGALDVSRLAALHPAVQAAAIRLFIAERIGGLRGIERAHIEAIRKLVESGGPSAEVSLPRGWRAVRRYNLLHIAGANRSRARGFCVPIRLDGTTPVEAAGFAFRASTHRAGTIAMPADLSSAVFDAAKIVDREFVARNFVPGDRVSPLGMRGRRKMKDIFVDRKLERARRGSFPLVAIGAEIAWAPGLVRSRHALVTGRTERVVRLDAVAMAF
ncbi:MAG: tRNA lysidine(34) synthetase TilS [Candidatus Binataceae bacterium]